MATSHSFGGPWTERKLETLRKYLEAYMSIFKGNERAQYFQTHFVDGFAGTGYRTIERIDTPTLFDDEVSENEATSFRKGSAQIALEISKSFDNYVFIEKDASRVKELEALANQYPGLYNQIRVLKGDTNELLRNWIREIDWRNNRAVVFLDPYGLQVEWSTLEELAATQAIDLWVLVPLGQGVNRLLTHQPPPEAWAKRLTVFFGTDEWQAAFYKPKSAFQLGLFEDSQDSPQSKNATLREIAEFFIGRLEQRFAKVVKQPLYLENSKQVPIYLLCFAASNPLGAPTAVKIAQSIIGKINT